MVYHIETSQEPNGRWVAKVPAVPGLLVYGQTEAETLVAAEKLTAILLAEGNKSGRGIVAFYPGRIPDSAGVAGQPSERPASKATLVTSGSLASEGVHLLPPQRE
jgi:predicted RNase H-like HicB family nuclease